jgi:hypothetical protein
MYGQDDAEAYHEIKQMHFSADFDFQHTTRLRICCIQPSPNWKEYGLRQLRFYSFELPGSPAVPCHIPHQSS